MDKLNSWHVIRVIQTILAMVAVAKLISASSSPPRNIYEWKQSVNSSLNFGINKMHNDNDSYKRAISLVDAPNLINYLEQKELAAALSLIVCNLSLKSIYITHESELKTNLVNSIIGELMKCKSPPTLNLLK